MPSHLTRSVFRRLLSSEPLVFHRQPLRHSKARPSVHHARVLFQQPQRRTFLGMFRQKPKRDITEPLLDPGMREMLTLERKIHLIVRLQPSDALATAFNAFIKAKIGSSQPIEDFHAVRLLQTFETMENDSKKPSAGWWLTPEELKRALYAIATNPQDKLEAVHNQLARKVYERIPQDSYKDPEESSAEPEQIQDFCRFLTVLNCTGETTEARRMLLEKMKDNTLQPSSDKWSTKPWLSILEGFVREANEAEFLKTIPEIEHSKDPQSIRAVVLFFAERNNLSEVKKWFTPGLLSSPRRDVQTIKQVARLHRAILELCLRNDELGWVDDAFSETSRKWQQIALVLAGASTGKSVEEIDRMLEVISKRSPKEKEQIDISVFNSLIEFAAGKNDPYQAERFLSLAHKWNARPNAQTYIHQISYRLDVGDLRGAQASYDLLRDQTIEGNEDWGIMNKMMRTLAKDPKTPKDDITALAGDIAARKKLFPPDTVTALALYHLARDEYFEIADLLQTYAHQYSIRDRESMLEALAEVAMRPEQDTARTWDTYMIMHQVFDLEARRPLRQAVMARMFRRGRADLGVHVFTRMMRHVRADARPDHSTYVAALDGIARTADPDALEVVHNLLKLDTDVEPSTQLRTALMLAYVAAGAPWRALEFWEEIATSAEGPSPASLHAALRACERSPFGERTARAIWTRLREADIAIDLPLLASYVGALAGTRQFDEIAQLIPAAQDITGAPADAFVLATLFNATRGIDRQAGVEEWLRDNHPAAWEELERRGFDVDGDGFRTVRGLDRHVEP